MKSNLDGSLSEALSANAETVLSDKGVVITTDLALSGASSEVLGVGPEEVSHLVEELGGLR